MKKEIFLTLGLAFVLGNSASAAVIADPSLSSVIDPSGFGQDVDSSFGTAETTLEARSDLQVLSSFTGFTSGDNVVNFTNGYPDIQFAWTGQAGSASGQVNTNTSYSTGTTGDTFMRQRHIDTTTGASSTLTVTFGTWGGSSFSNDRSVGAAGFVLTNVYANKSGVVTFFDSSDNALSTLNYTGGNDPDSLNADTTSNGSGDLYFGWDSDAESSAEIAKITITFVDSASEFDSGFDDFAFAAVPEPSAAVFVTLSLLGLAIRRRR